MTPIVLFGKVCIEDEGKDTIMKKKQKNHLASEHVAAKKYAQFEAKARKMSLSSWKKMMGL